MYKYHMAAGTMTMPTVKETQSQAQRTCSATRRARRTLLLPHAPPCPLPSALMRGITIHHTSVADCHAKRSGSTSPGGILNRRRVPSIHETKQLLRVGIMTLLQAAEHGSMHLARCMYSHKCRFVHTSSTCWHGGAAAAAGKATPMARQATRGWHTHPLILGSALGVRVEVLAVQALSCCLCQALLSIKHQGGDYVAAQGPTCTKAQQLHAAWQP